MRVLQFGLVIQKRDYSMQVSRVITGSFILYAVVLMRVDVEIVLLSSM